MMDSSDISVLPRVVCRPALHKDTPDVMELTSTIWQGQDYVPTVWEAWLADPEGLLAVAEFAGSIVGLAKLSLISAGEWWLEGLRVHPKFEGRGIASRLHEYILNYWHRKGDGFLRLATGSNRLPVHHLCDRTGFARINEFTIFAAPAIDAPLGGKFSPIKIEDADIVLNKIRQNSISPFFSNLINLGWQFVHITEQHVQGSVERGNAWWWHDRESIFLLFEDTDDHGESVPVIRAIACSLDNLRDVLLDYRILASHLGYKRAAWVVPLVERIVTPLLSSGFQRDWDLSIILYEKHHEGGVV